MSRSSAFAFAAALLFACGGGGGGGPGAPAPSPPPQPSAPPAPAPTPTPTAAPTSAVELVIEALVASGDCAGVVPASVPPAVALAAAAPPGGRCLGATGDGTGHVAVGARGSDDAATWTVFTSAGERTGAITERGLLELTRQPRGWAGIAAAPLDAPFEQQEVVHVAPEGAVDRRTRLEGREGFATTDARIASDPSGGAAVAAALAAVGGNHFAATEAFLFDAAGGAPVGGVQLMTDSSPVVSFLGVGVSSLGGVFVSYRLPGTFAWTWLTRDGGVAAQGQAAQADVGAADPVLVEPLLDGSVAVRFAGAWSAAVGHLATTATPPPAWLASRSGTSLRFTRGNRGYAVLPAPGEQLPDCTQVVELRSRSGQLCGRVAVREGAGPCTGASLEQGWDGTLIRAPVGDACSAGTCACTAQAWPRLLAGE